ncbi:MAG: nucleic acid-binding protein contains PIN domain [bacterium]|nr:MAG: nucleic acid-binding protein contains PIN domain [bacterium]KAF0149845.1 MAG: nucleic acid-binding protein contains PIN domain [bacterium]KAF0168546.1 MAG: nucleic acid-binding protein contains PIN domain [bacterium]TXT19520.1 MAG: nucleic acid-binding protein contains PIN domain [bacterium]
MLHPWIIGELACGQLGNRAELLALLGALPSLNPASEEETLLFIEKRRLMGRGIGYIDVHLLVACVMHGTTLWTRDQRLAKVAVELGLADQPNAH